MQRGITNDRAAHLPFLQMSRHQPDASTAPNRRMQQKLPTGAPHATKVPLPIIYQHRLTLMIV
jgi:hypothetical protein